MSHRSFTILHTRCSFGYPLLCFRFLIPCSLDIGRRTIDLLRTLLNKRVLGLPVGHRALDPPSLHLSVSFAVHSSLVDLSLG